MGFRHVAWNTTLVIRREQGAPQMSILSKGRRMILERRLLRETSRRELCEFRNKERDYIENITKKNKLKEFGFESKGKGYIASISSRANIYQRYYKIVERMYYTCIFRVRTFKRNLISHFYIIERRYCNCEWMIA